MRRCDMEREIRRKWWEEILRGLDEDRPDPIILPDDPVDDED